MSRRALAAWACAGLAGACRPSVPPADRAALAARLDFPGATGPLGATFGPPMDAGAGVAVRPVSFVVADGFRVGAALYTPARPTGACAVVPHGHFGGGKSDPEAQEIARSLAARGARVIAVDSPGVEEGDAPDRQIHFEAGEHARAYLASAGTSALALQVTALRRGLDLLTADGPCPGGVAATGATGGAVLSFWLAVADPRVTAAVLASPVPLPRELRATGCACDQLPGVPGPDPSVVAALPVPSLWLADGLPTAPDGLPPDADWVRLDAPHGYDASMQAAALDWLDGRLTLAAPPPPGPAPLLTLRSPGVPGPAVFTLAAARGPSPWAPAADPRPTPWTVHCDGRGPTVLAAGLSAAERAAVQAGGARVCAVTVELDPLAVTESVGGAAPAAGRVAAALADAARAEGAVELVVAGAWALPAAAVGLPATLLRPVETAADAAARGEPAWVHVPGAWGPDGAMARARAAATGGAAGRGALRGEPQVPPAP